MGLLPEVFQERPRQIEALRMIDSDAVGDIAEFVGARYWTPMEGDVEFLYRERGSLVVGWGDWVVKLGEGHFEAMPAALFQVLYERVF